MLALVLMVGIVIDDAIVVLENIFRFIEEKKVMPFQAAIDATKEIGIAVLATTLSLVAVFLPVAFMGGIVGRFMNSFGLTMAFAILVSLLVSFSLTPMLSARFLKRKEEKEKSKSRGFYAVIDRTYMAMLKWSMAHRWLVVLACATLAFQCAVYDATLLSPAPADTGPPDTGADAGIEADTLHHWPPRPSAARGSRPAPTPVASGR